MRVIFIIPSRPPPTLTNPESFSPEMNAFIARCLTKDQEARPTAKEMADDPWVASWTGDSKPLASLVETMLEVVASTEVKRERMFVWCSSCCFLGWAYCFVGQ